jgi:hypothetical protein
VGTIFGGFVLAILSQGIHSPSGELAIVGSVCYVARRACTGSHKGWLFLP